MASTVHRLEQALCIWEESFLTMSAGAHAMVGLGKSPPAILSGPILHWHEFRRYLLESLTSDSFDDQRFMGDEDIIRLMKLSGGFMAYLPMALACWTRSSRRVYHVTDELQHLLHVTSLDGITWAEVPWPFPSFGITLDVPILDPKGNKYDFLLVSREVSLDNKRPMLSIRLFNADMEGYSTLTRNQRARVRLAIQRKQWDKIRLFLDEQKGKNAELECSVIVLDEENNRNDLVTDSIVKIGDMSEQHQLDDIAGQPHKDNYPHWDVASRLVVGLCLYLKMLRPGSEHVSEWKKVERKMSLDPLAVTKEAEVCTVTSIHKLTKEERDLIQGSLTSARAYHELRVHFREGHWRRRPGYGNDPEAPYVVMVKPTIVRRDRLPMGAVPGGTEQVL